MQTIFTETAPIPNGPYSQAIHVGPFLFCSGQTPRNPTTMEFSSELLEGQANQVLLNLKSVVEAANFHLNDIVKTSVFLRSMDDFGKMNEVYSNFFGTHCPVRTTVAVSGLPKGALIVIDCVAFKKS